MLVNISYRDRDLKEKMEKEVGKPFNLRERIRLKGIGSPRLSITSCCLDIHNLLVLDQNLNTCNIELRPRGIVIRFRSLLETYALVIPFYKLSLYKGKSDEYAIYRDHYFIRIAARRPDTHRFMSKVLHLKNEQRPGYIDDI
jgi:hypothetical protein